MDWLEPWWSTDEFDAHFHQTFLEQLERELAPGHPLYGLPVKLIGRGRGDDALFQLLDGSGRVAQVHLTWGQRQQPLPWPATAIHLDLETWIDEVMRPEHEDWKAG